MVRREIAKVERTFRVFVSSTFADFTTEREALQSRVFPQLRQLCAGLEAKLEAVDMRWGVSSEAVEAQEAMQICLRELQRCLDTGLRPFLLILLGDRYGSRPIPDEIEPPVFERIVSCVGAAGGAPAGDELRRHYPLDENALEPVHRLDFDRDGAMEPRGRWALAESLRSLLDTGAERVPPDQRWRVDASATEREIQESLRLLGRRARHALCCIRTLSGPGRLAAPWVDIENGRRQRGSATRILRLRAQVRDTLGKRAIGFRARLVKGSPDASYLRRFCRTVLQQLGNDIRAQAAVWRKETPLDREIASHQRFAANHSRDFVGRDESREKIARYLARPRRRPLVVSGESGIGKSALLAAAVRDFLKAQPRTRVVQRFIGATPRSTKGGSLLADLYSELGRGANSKAQEAPRNTGRLVAELKKLLASTRNPLVLFIDALDQIPDGDLACDLHWLPAELPRNVRLILSAVAGSRALQQAERKYPKRAEIPLKGLAVEEGGRLLDLWLARAGRRLQPAQAASIHLAFAEHRSPLHLRLVAGEAARLRSTDRPFRFQKTAGAVVGSLLDRLSLGQNHGKLFVERSLAYIAASRHGLSHDEIRRALWQDAEVRREYLRRHSKSPRVTHAVAPLVWARLYHELSDYLTLRAGPGEELLGFFHSEVQRAVEKRLLGKERAERHRQLARTFTPGRGKPFAPRAYSELVCQLGNAGEWARASALFGNAAFVAGSLREMGTEAIIADIDLALERGKNRLPDHAHIEALRRALAQSSHVLDRGQGEVTAQLLGRLRAHDDPATRKLLRGLRRNEGGAWLEPLGESLERSGLLRVLDLRIFDEEDAAQPQAPEDQRVPRVWDLHLCPDQRTILTALHDGTVRMWDAATGRMLAVLAGHEGGVDSVTSTPDGRHAVSAGHDGCLVVWDLLSREPVRRFKGSRAATAVAVLPDGTRFIAGFADGRIRIWPLHGGSRPWTLHRGHRGSIWRMAVARDNRSAVSTSQDGTARQWDLRTGRNRVVVGLGERSNLLRAVQLTGDGRYAMTATGSGDVITTRLSTMRSSVTHVLPVVIRDLALARNERSVISVSQSGHLAVSDLHGHRVSMRMQAHGDEVNTVDLARDGRTLYTGASDGVVKVWDLSVLRRSGREPAHRMGLVGVTEVKHGRELISADEGGCVHAWDTRSGRHLRTIPVGCDGLQGLEASADGRYLVYVSDDEHFRSDGVDGARLHLRDLKRNREWGIPTRSPGRDSFLTLSPDGKLILAVTDEEDISVFSFPSRQPMLKLRKVGHHVVGVLVTRDGRRAVVTSWIADDYGRMRILVFDLTSGRRERVLVDDAKNIGPQALRGNGQLLTAGGDGRVRLWDLPTGKVIRSFRADPEAVASVALLPGGRRAVTAGADGQIKTWDIDRAVQLDTLGSARGLLGANLSPGGRLCLSTTKGWSIHVWDVEARKLLATFTANDRIGWSRVLRDEQTVVVGELTGALHFLRLVARGRPVS